MTGAPRSRSGKDAETMLFVEYMNQQLTLAVSGSSLAGICRVVPWNRQLPAGWAVQWALPTLDVEGVDLARSAPNYSVPVAMSAPEGSEEEFADHYLGFEDSRSLIYGLSRLPFFWSEFTPSLAEYPGGKRLEARAEATLQGHHLRVA